jgi:hypothetical protein
VCTNRIVLLYIAFATVAVVFYKSFPKQMLAVFLLVFVLVFVWEVWLVGWVAQFPGLALFSSDVFPSFTLLGARYQSRAPWQRTPTSNTRRRPPQR